MRGANDLLVAFELHDPSQIRAVLKAGASATSVLKGRRPIDWLIAMYTRSPRFAECVQVMLEAGAEVGDPALEAILLDDDTRLTPIAADTHNRQFSLEGAYTSLKGVSALHVRAEFNLRAVPQSREGRIYSSDATNARRTIIDWRLLLGGEASRCQGVRPHGSGARIMAS